MVRAYSLRIAGKTKSAGGVRLRIAIDKQTFNFRGSEGCRQVDGGCGLAYAAFLIHDSNDASHGGLVRRNSPLAPECKTRQEICAMPKNGAVFHVEHRPHMILRSVPRGTHYVLLWFITLGGYKPDHFTGQHPPKYR